MIKAGESMMIGSVSLKRRRSQTFGPLIINYIRVIISVPYKLYDTGNSQIIVTTSLSESC